jgi:hypothetical protein
MGKTGNLVKMKICGRKLPKIPIGKSGKMPIRKSGKMQRGDLVTE